MEVAELDKERFAEKCLRVTNLQSIISRRACRVFAKLHSREEEQSKHVIRNDKADIISLLY